MASSTVYKKVERKQFAQSVKRVTPENEYWNAFKPKLKDRLHSNVPFVRFTPTDPFDFVTCSNYDLRVFRSSTWKTYKKLGFKGQPLVCDVRRDTKLIAVGGKNGLFRLYNNSHSAGLESMRSLKGHFSDIYDLHWQSTDSTRIVSFANDKTCRYWDIIAPQQIVSIRGHSDFIKTGDWIHNSNSCIISGSYDHYCKLWDLRDIKTINNINNDNTDNNTIVHQCDASFNHGLPIESVLSIPNTDLIAIAGGPKVTIWSIRKSNKPLTTIELHRKSVTCLTTNASGSRLLTGCLDNHVRVFTTSITGDSVFRNSHAFTTPSAVLSLSMASNDMCIAVGTLKNGVIGYVAEGHTKSFEKYVQLQQYEDDPIAKYDDEIKNWMESRNRLRYMTEEQALGDADYIRYGSKDWFLRGQKLKLPANMDNADLSNKIQKQTQQLDVTNLTSRTMLVRFKNKKKLKQYDNALRQFRYSDGLDFALKAKDTLTVHSVLEDLWRRDGLEIALGGRDSNRLTPILEYLIYSLPHPHLTQTAVHVSAIIIDLYKPIIGLDDNADYLFKTMFDIINNMVEKYKILLKLQGSLDMVLSAQDIVQNPLPQNMLNLSNKIQKIMKETKLKYESKQNDESNDNQTHDKMDMD